MDHHLPELRGVNTPVAVSATMVGCCGGHPTTPIGAEIVTQDLVSKLEVSAMPALSAESFRMVLLLLLL